MNKTIACSVARAEKELGYRPAFELEEGMRRSLALVRQPRKWTSLKCRRRGDESLIIAS